MSARIAVLGGGVSGLVAARELARNAGDAQVIVVESSGRAGGKIHRATLGEGAPTIRAVDTSVVDSSAADVAAAEVAGAVDAVTVDTGAESLLARRPEALQLISDLGLNDQLRYPTGAKPSVLVDGEPRRLPPTVMGIPTDLDALGEHLSPAGLDRARQEPDIPAPPFDSDIGLGTYTDQRFGAEVTDRLVEPMLSGVYAGQCRNLSFEAVHPTLFRAARTGGSLLTHARAVRPAPPDDGRPAGPAFVGLYGGVGALIDELVDDLSRRQVTIRHNCTVRSLRQLRTGQFELVSGPVPRPEVTVVDRVLVATPATAAARLVGDLSSDAGQELARIPYASTALITAVLTGADMDGSGLLVPPGELDMIKAFTHSARKWGWIAEDCARVFGADATVVRISVGRYGDEPRLQINDHELVDRTLAEAQHVPGWRHADLRQAVVQRWGGGLPQYLVGHRGRVARLQHAVDQIEGLEIAGAYLDGVGVPACIAAAQRAASMVLD